MKKPFRIYLTQEEYNKFKSKAQENGFNGRGWSSHFIERLCQYEFIWIDKNIEKFISLIDVSIKAKK